MTPTFCFYNEEEFVGFAFAISNKSFLHQLFAIMPHLRAMDMEEKSLKTH